VFIAAAMDHYLRAFDIDTGSELWKGRLLASGQAMPMAYRLRPDRWRTPEHDADIHGLSWAECCPQASVLPAITASVLNRSIPAA